MSVHYGVLPRAGGPGSGPEPVTPTPGNLAMVYQARLDCLDTSPLLPVMREIVDISPMLVVCSLDHDYIAEGENTRWLEAGKEIHDAHFAAPPTSLQELLAWQRIRNTETTPLFGNQGPNRDALEALDLSSYPEIVGLYRDSYRSIFFTSEPFAAPQWKAFGQGVWRTEIMESLVALLQDADSDFMLLERWYHHAVTSLSIPVLERFV